MRSVDTVTAFVRNDRSRRLAYLVVGIVSAILIFFPQPFVARAKIVPQDTAASAASTTALIGALGGQASSIGSLLGGGRPSNDLYLIIGRSDSVATDVVQALGLVGPNAPFKSFRKAKLYLDRHVDIHLLLGGVMEIETKLYDPDKAVRFTTAYEHAIGRHLASFGKQIIQNKQRIVRQRYADALARLASAEAEVNSFRRANNLADPEQQLGAALSQRAQLEAQLQAKLVELQTAEQFRGPESNDLAAIRSDIAGLRQQIVRTTRPASTAGGPNVAGLTSVQLQYLNLYRKLRFQQAILEVYQRSAEQVEVETLAAESASYFQVIDPANLDPKRQYNVWAMALFGGIVLLALFTEWYAPATGLIRKRTIIEDSPRTALAHD
ncbi:MAG: hypothetical protein QOF05_1420 [Sphingomonadales bacterium]|nr:hypothetical protein [Sphingomonadales bacterium]